MAAPEKYVGTQVESVMELLSKIVRRPPGGAGFGESPLLSTVLPALLVTMITCDIEVPI